MITERILEFECAGTLLRGVLHRPEGDCQRGLIVIGRTGSDRLGVLLARGCALRGVTVFRFDFRGRGDCEGPVVSVEETGEDLASAIQAFQEAVPSLEEVALWGLSEGAAAALLYAQTDARVTGVCLVNPWIRMDLAVARRHLKQNVERLSERTFWDQIRRSEAGYLGAVQSFVRLVRNVIAAPNRPDPLKLRVINGLAKFTGPVCLVLSGQDPATAVFQIATEKHLRALAEEGRLVRYDLPEANHMFSRSDWRETLIGWTADWMLKTNRNLAPIAPLLRTRAIWI